MRKYLQPIVLLSLCKSFIQLAGNINYGFHRDELLHLSVGEHLDWGFMEFPPFIALLGKTSGLIFDYSLWGMRLFPTVAGVAILVLSCLMAIEFGGRSKAVLLSGVFVLAFLPFYRNHTLFQPVAFDQLFWTLGFHLFIKYINTKKSKYLILLGLCAGIGLMNKYTLVVWGFGLVAGMLFYNNGELFKNKILYVAGLLAFLLFLPNLLWQLQHDFPILMHLKALKQEQLGKLSPFEFGKVQLFFPFTLIVSIIGIVALFSDEQLKKFKSIAVAAIVAFTTMWMLQSKAYYIFSVYPVLFSAGAVKIEKLFTKRPVWNYVVALIVLLPSIPFIPDLTPIMPIEKFVFYANKPEVNGRVELTSDYADMFGWEEQVQLVDSVYRSLTVEERRNCVLWAENYGEAGALMILGNKYGLPDPICRHGSFWLWGYGNKDAEVWISLGNERPAVEHVFEEMQLVKIIRHKYAIDEENNIPLFLCRKPKINIEEWWRAYEEHIFD